MSVVAAPLCHVVCGITYSPRPATILLPGQYISPTGGQPLCDLNSQPLEFHFSAKKKL